jgi:hypothetical protein
MQKSKILKYVQILAARKNQADLRTSKVSGSITGPSSSSRFKCAIEAGAPPAAAGGLLGGSAFFEGFPAFRTSCSISWCSLPQPSMVQLGHLPMVSHSLPIRYLKQNRHSCFMWIKSSLSFCAMSRNVGQLSGVCFRVHPNTGQCVLFLLGGPAADDASLPDPPPASAVGSVSFCPSPAAVLAVFSVAPTPVFFFLAMAVAPLDGVAFSDGAVDVLGGICRRSVVRPAPRPPQVVTPLLRWIPGNDSHFRPRAPTSAWFGGCE